MQDTKDKTFTKDNAIQFLVDKKFSLLHRLKVYQEIPTHIGPYEHTKMVDDMVAYSDDLKAKSDLEIDLMYKEAIAEEQKKKLEKHKEDQERKLKEKIEEDRKFYSQPHMLADLSYWSKMATWEAEWFVALALGKNPKIINWENIRRTLNSPFVIQYSELRDLLSNTVSSGRLQWDDKPINFINWAKHNDISAPEGLEELVKKYSIYSDWENKYRKLSIEFNKLKKEQENNVPIKVEPEKPMHKKERDSLRKMFIGMAASFYKAERLINETIKAKDISDDLLRDHGIEVSDDTIRPHLKEALQYIKKPANEQN